MTPAGGPLKVEILLTHLTVQITPPDILSAGALR